MTVPERPNRKPDLTINASNRYKAYIEVWLDEMVECFIDGDKDKEYTHIKFISDETVEYYDHKCHRWATYEHTIFEKVANRAISNFIADKILLEDI